MSRDSGRAELELRDYLVILRRRLGTIVAVAVVAVSVSLVVSYVQTPRYRAGAEVLLQPSGAGDPFNPSPNQRADPARAVHTEIRMLESEPVRAAVRKTLGSVPPVSATSIGETDVIKVAATSTDPQRAARVANAYAEAYVDLRQQQAVDGLLKAVEKIQVKVDELQAQIDSLDQQIAQMPPNARVAPDNPLVPRRTVLIQQQAAFQGRLDEVQVTANLKTGDAQLVTPAATPLRPVSPRPRRDAAVALVVGVLLGVAVAFLREHLDDSIKTKTELERVADGLPTLGIIPVEATWRVRDEPFIVSRAEPFSPSAEAFRSLRTALEFISLDRPVHTVQITSPKAGEGKTATLSNLAIALSRAGKRVAVVSCDLRRPRLHEFFGVPNTVGFTSVLLGEMSLEAAVVRVKGETNLGVLASGPLPPNPSELLASARTAEILTALQAHFDMVLVDSPPVLPATDAAVISGRVDVSLVVARAGETGRREMARTIELLRQVDAPLIGVVLNGARHEPGSGYGYQYQYRAREERARRGGLLRIR
jgi:capsular exopolysaccharide synthesis family protein